MRRSPLNRRRVLPDCHVRAVERGDRDQWAPLWRAYLDFYEAVETPEVTEAVWSRIFDPLEPVHAVAAERDGALVGFSITFSSARPWLVNPRCYPQDLYVIPAARGAGVGRALIGAVCAWAKAAGAADALLEHARDERPGAAPYDALAKRTGFIQYRIDDL